MVDRCRTCRAAASRPTLSATMTPMAPASWAFFTFTVKVQIPRSMSAILPCRLVVIAEQPSVGSRAAGAVLVRDPGRGATLPCTPGALSGGTEQRGADAEAAQRGRLGDRDLRRARPQHVRDGGGDGGAGPDHVVGVDGGGHPLAVGHLRPGLVEGGVEHEGVVDVRKALELLAGRAAVEAARSRGRGPSRGGARSPGRCRCRGCRPGRSTSSAPRGSSPCRGRR